MSPEKYRSAMRRWACGKATRREILDCLAYQRRRDSDAERRQEVTPSGTPQQSCQDARDATVASAPARNPSR